VREQPTSTLQAAIHSPADHGATLKRANTCLALYFEPDPDDPEARAAVREAFVRALAHVPSWAMHRAFDQWERTGQRRPSPGEIVILAERALQPLVREVDDRKRNTEAAAEARRAAEEERTPEQRRRAQEIVERCGFTAKMTEAIRKKPGSSSMAEAVEAAGREERVPHWTELEPPGSAALAQLEAARAANPIIAAARAGEAARRQSITTPNEENDHEHRHA
jgi:hypothetical protein